MKKIRNLPYSIEQRLIGLEPTTFCLEGNYSTTELQALTSYGLGVSRWGIYRERWGETKEPTPPNGETS